MSLFPLSTVVITYVQQRLVFIQFQLTLESEKNHIKCGALQSLFVILRGFLNLMSMKFYFFNTMLHASYFIYTKRPTQVKNHFQSALLSAEQLCS